MGANAYLLPLIGIGYFLWLATLVARPGRQRFAFCLAAASTILWAAIAYWDEYVAALPQSLTVVAGVVRLWTWVWLVAQLLSLWSSPVDPETGRKVRSPGSAPMQIASAVALASIVVAVAAQWVGPMYEPFANATVGRLCLAVIGFMQLIVGRRDIGRRGQAASARQIQVAGGG